VVAIGETGLDFNRNFSPPDRQIVSFEQHLELACRLKMPLFLHERDAHSTQLEILKPWESRVTGVIHCFTGSLTALTNYLDMGFYVGITGWVCDERRGADLQSIIRHIPLDRLLVETDAPYLLPRTLRPRPKDGRNEPAFLPEVVQGIAAHTAYSYEEIARATTENAATLFGLRD
jgi:TatD DNase family protein